jgi:hypothetical protein
VPLLEIGARGVEVLLAQIAAAAAATPLRGAAGDTVPACPHIELPTHLVIGDSTAPVTAAPQRPSSRRKPP